MGVTLVCGVSHETVYEHVVHLRKVKVDKHAAGGSKKLLWALVLLISDFSRQIFSGMVGLNVL